MATKGLQPKTTRAILATAQAAEDDATAAAIRNEHLRYEREVIDFETQVCRSRDAMKRGHLENLSAILNGSGEEG